MKKRKDTFSRIVFILFFTSILFVLSVTTTILPVSAQQSNFDPETYNPRFELGLGGGATYLNKIPDWSADQYFSGRLSFSVRIVNGFFIQGGKEIAYGSDLDTKWFDYGPQYRLKASMLPFQTGSWAGIRIDIPMTVLKRPYFGIHSILLTGGLVWNEYYIRGGIQEYYRTEYGYTTDEIPVKLDEIRRDRVADMNGYYLGAAARWKLSPEMTSNPDSWYGHYGIDAGLRYIVYNESTLAYDTLMEAPSGFSGFQLFATFFLKFDLL